MAFGCDVLRRRIQDEGVQPSGEYGGAQADGVKLVKQDKSKHVKRSLNKRRFIASMNTDYVDELLSHYVASQTGEAQESKRRLTRAEANRDRLFSIGIPSIQG